VGASSAEVLSPVCTGNLIRVDDVMESPKLAGMIRQFCFVLCESASRLTHRKGQGLEPIHRRIRSEPGRRLFFSAVSDPCGL
jgi:hypothetical protein